jgi:hypothetical protein
MPMATEVSSALERRLPDFPELLVFIFPFLAPQELGLFNYKITLTISTAACQDFIV